MEKPAYKNYIFDFYGTLVDIRTDEKNPRLWEDLVQYYSKSGAVYTAAQLRQRYRMLLTAQEQDLLQAGLPAYPEVDLLAVFKKLYLEAAPVPVLMDEAELWAWKAARYFRDRSRQHFQVYPNSKAVLQALKDAGCRIYLLSNAQAAFTNPELDESGLRDCFGGIYLSSDAGICKPEPAFLKKVLDDQGLKAEETVMIGNDFSTDIAIAEALGLDAILLNTFPYSRQELDRLNQAQHPVFTDIKEILDYEKRPSGAKEQRQDSSERED